ISLPARHRRGCGGHVHRAGGDRRRPCRDAQPGALGRHRHVFARCVRACGAGGDHRGGQRRGEEVARSCAAGGARDLNRILGPEAQARESIASASGFPATWCPMANKTGQEKLKNENRLLIVCDVLALIFTMGFPSLMTWLEFVLLRGTTGDGNQAMQVSFWLGKVLQFFFPIVYVWFRARDSVHFERPNKRGMLVGIAFVLVGSAGPWALYFFWLPPSPAMAGTPAQVRHWLHEFNPFFTTLAGYILMAVFMAVAHSFLEEYYWR